jgi:hypothetical protein
MSDLRLDNGSIKPYLLALISIQLGLSRYLTHFFLLHDSVVTM